MKKQYKLILFLFALLVIVQFISFVPAPAPCEPPNTEIFTCSGMYDKTVYAEPYIATYIGSCPGQTEAEGGGSAAINCLGNPTFCHVGNEYSCSLTQYIVSTSCSGLSESACSSKYPDCTGSTECVPDAPQCSINSDCGLVEYCNAGTCDIVDCNNGVCGTTDMNHGCAYYNSGTACNSNLGTCDGAGVCVANPICGDNINDLGEECDDGDTVATVCTVPAGQTSCIYCSADCQDLTNNVDSTTCTTTPATDDIVNGDQDVQGSSTLTTTYTVSSPTSNTLEDYCTGTTLTEYYCAGPVGSQTRESRSVTCSIDCQAGACVAISSLSCTTTPAADDTANGDEFTQGTSTLTTTYSDASSTSDPLTDYCTGMTLTEYHCIGSGLSQSIDIRSPTCSYDCQAGACVTPPAEITTTCSETEVNSVTIVGTSTLSTFSDGTLVSEVPQTDICIDSKNLNEYYCSGTSPNHLIENREYECSGACISGECRDIIPESYTCVQDPVTDNNDELIRGISILTTTYNDASTSELARQDTCLTSNDLTEYHCQSATSSTISSATIPCTFGCFNGVCSEFVPVPNLYWGRTSNYLTAASQTESVVGSSESYSVRLVVYNPNAVATTTFQIFERDFGGALDGASDSVITSIPATAIGEYLVGDYTFRTSILNTINDLGNENSPYDFYFEATGFTGDSNNLVVGISEAVVPVACSTDTAELRADHFENGICTFALGENGAECPLDCFAEDGVCNNGILATPDLGENHHNSPTDCPLDSRAEWVYTSAPYQAIRDDISVNKDNIDSQSFNMVYMKSPLSLERTFTVQGLNLAGEWQTIDTPMGSESNGDINSTWSLTYTNFWELGHPSSETTYQFKFTIDGVVSNTLTIVLTGEIPTCDDDESNGAEEGLENEPDCGGECGILSNPGIAVCTGINSCVDVVYACSEYDINTCDAYECLVGAEEGKGCAWNEVSSTCDTVDIGIVGSCYYIEDDLGDDCSDGYFSYDYITNFIWNDWVKNKSTESVGWSLDNRTGVDIYYQDPEGEFLECSPGSEIIACPAQVKLSFWDWKNFVAAIILIFIGYYTLKKKKKKVSTPKGVPSTKVKGKKKVSKKKSVKKKTKKVVTKKKKKISKKK